MTIKEKKFLKLIAAGRNYKEIAELLGMHRNTVSKWRIKMRKKENLIESAMIESKHIPKPEFEENTDPIWKRCIDENSAFGKAHSKLMYEGRLKHHKKHGYMVDGKPVPVFKLIELAGVAV